jgi:Fur family peroxide stress response transcriptional regulator
MNDIEDVLERFRDTGLKVTPQRLEIIEILEHNRSHPSADEILHEVRKRFPSTSYSTVYSTLDALHKLGEIRKLTIDPRCVRYDPNTRIHQHLICRKCKKIVDVPRDYLAHLQVPAEIRRHFDIEDYHVEFRGLCSQCRGPVGPKGKKRGPKPKKKKKT